jgi:hypothetical protein
MVFIAIVYSVIGVLMVRKFIPVNLTKAHNDLLDPVFSASAMAYSIFLAFAVIVAWQNFDIAKTHVVKEAQIISAIYRDSAALEEPIRSNAQTLIKEYIAVATTEEWKLLGQGKESMRATNILSELWSIYVNYDLGTHERSVFFTELVHQLSDLRELRGLRIMDSHECMNPLLLAILFVGTIMVITLSFFFGADKFFIHALSTAVFSVITALILFIIVIFSYPYTGDFIIDPELYSENVGILI